MQFQLHIKIRDITVTSVWRRILVPADFSFDQLHDIIQAAFNWDDDHLYAFYSKQGSQTLQIGIPFADRWYEDYKKNSIETKLSEVLIKKGQKINYVYDFGDNWILVIKVEKITDDEATEATYIEGKGASPFDYCGGPWGYEEILEILADPEDEEYEEKREWMGLRDGEEWDIEKFDEEKIRKKIAKI